MNHKKVLRLMQEMGIRSIIRAKRPYFSNYTALGSSASICLP
ncbi:MAG: hypothetical protein ACE3L7_09190 [Candidatus Pristimantibacillus sp.]